MNLDEAMARDTREKLNAVRAEQTAADHWGAAIGAGTRASADLCAGSIYADTSMPRRPGLRERLRTNLRFAREQVQKTEMMNELEYLLEKNPEVARILELMEEVKQ